MFDYFKKIPNKKLVALSKQSETKILEDNQMLKQISIALAILCASITVTIFPAMSEINQPDATAKEKQIEDNKHSLEIKATNKKKGSHRHGDMRRKGHKTHNKGRFGRGKKTRHKSRFEGQRHGRSDAGYRRDNHQRKHPSREQRMSQNRRFRDRQSSDIEKGKSGKMLSPELAKHLTDEQRQEVQQAVKELRQQQHRQMKSKIAGLLQEYNIELPEPKEKKPTVDK